MRRLWRSASFSRDSLIIGPPRIVLRSTRGQGSLPAGPAAGRASSLHRSAKGQRKPAGKEGVGRDGAAARMRLGCGSLAARWGAATATRPEKARCGFRDAWSMTILRGCGEAHARGGAQPLDDAERTSSTPEPRGLSAPGNSRESCARDNRGGTGWAGVVRAQPLGENGS